MLAVDASCDDGGGFAGDGVSDAAFDGAGVAADIANRVEDGNWVRADEKGNTGRGALRADSYPVRAAALRAGGCRNFWSSVSSDWHTWLATTVGTGPNNLFLALKAATSASIGPQEWDIFVSHAPIVS